MLCSKVSEEMNENFEKRSVDVESFVEKVFQNKLKYPASREFENLLFWNLSDFDYRRAIYLSKESDDMNLVLSSK